MEIEKLVKEIEELKRRLTSVEGELAELRQKDDKNKDRTRKRSYSSPQSDILEVFKKVKTEPVVKEEILDSQEFYYSNLDPDYQPFNIGQGTSADPIDNDDEDHYPETSHNLADLLQDALFPEEDVSQAVQTYEGIQMTSSKGKHGVLVYRFGEDNNKCYSFCLKRKGGKADNYGCVNCKNNYKKTTGVRVANGKFLSDPAALDHLCEPKNFTVEFAGRYSYETKQNLRNSEWEATTTPKEAFSNMLNEIAHCHDFSKEQAGEIIAALDTFQKNRPAFAKAIKENKWAKSAKRRPTKFTNKITEIKEEPNVSVSDFVGNSHGFLTETAET